MKQLGLSPAETAIILSVTTALTGVVRAAVGIVADKLRRHRLIIFICCLIGGIFHFCILFVPPVASGPSPAVTEWKVCCRSTSLALCDGFVFNGSASESSPHSLTVDSSLLDALSRDRLRVCVLRCCGDFGNGIQGSERNSSVAALVTKSSESCRSVADLTMPSLSTVTNCSVGSDRNCDSDFRVALETNEFCMLADRNACFVVCGNVSTSDIRSDQLVPRYQETFILVFVLFFIGQSAFSPIFNLLDGLVYVYLGDKHGEFGKQRLWGTVAFGSFALTSGFIMVALSKYTANNSYLYSFIAFLCLLFMTGLTVYFYKKTPKSSSADGMTKTIRVLLCNFYLVVAYVVMLVAGMIAGDIEAFLFWFLNDLGAEQSVFGVALLVSSVLEAVVLFFSGALIKKFGFSACLYVVFAVYALRLLANSFIENPWVAVATEATQCICFGLLYPAVTSWGSTLTPPGMHGSVQGILGAMYLSIGEHRFLTPSRAANYKVTFTIFLADFWPIFSILTLLTHVCI